jgi:cytochrome c nitrite reductase small subunit
VMMGLAFGSVLYTFVYARGASYLVNDPAACANCHAMTDHYSAWIKSSHRSVATCNDCHTPHALVPKYLVKAENGFWHSLYFTTGNYPENIRARAISRRITEAACQRCHGAITADISHPHHGGKDLSCIRCHRTVGHDR